MKATAGFFRGKATECRNLAADADDRAAIARGLEAMALELDACAVALEAGRATAREIEPESSEEATGTAARGGRLIATDDADYFIRKARQCFRLAEACKEPEMASKLRRLSEEFIGEHTGAGPASIQP